MVVVTNMPEEDEEKERDEEEEEGKEREEEEKKEEEKKKKKIKSNFVMYTILIEVPPCNNSENYSDINGRRNLINTEKITRER